METNVTPLNNPINNIGIVKGYNKDTREVAVYMPKFMPGIVETKSIEAKTKYEGTIISDISYSPTIKTSPISFQRLDQRSSYLILTIILSLCIGSHLTQMAIMT